MKKQSRFSRHRVNAVIALLLLVLLCLACARKVRLSGTVRDMSGRPLVGAITTITSSPQGKAGREEFTADPAGRYSLYQPDGPDGAIYTFRVEVEGYKPFQRTITPGGYDKIEVVLGANANGGGAASIAESQGNNGLRLFVPQAGWEPSLFGPINQLVKEAKLADLRSGPLPDSDLEVRIWICNGVKPVHGFILQKTKGKDSGIYVGASSSAGGIQLTNPVNGTRQWYALWADLTKQMILSLPDASQLQGTSLDNTGESYVFETNSEGVYRTFRYTYQAAQQTKESEQARAIVALLYAQFGIVPLPQLGGEAGE